MILKFWLSFFLLILWVNLNSQASPLTFRSLPTAERIVCLTFDDGPNPGITEKILDILETYQVKASFFIVGKEAEKYPDLIFRIHQQGHDIENHSFSHPNLTLIPSENLTRELDRTNDVIEGISGVTPRFFRPPGGQYNTAVLSEADKHNLIMILWSVNAQDYIPGSPMHKLASVPAYKKQSATLHDLVLHSVKAGSVILMHNGIMDTVNSLPIIIRSLQEQGYKIRSLSEFFSEYFLSNKVQDKP